MPNSAQAIPACRLTYELDGKTVTLNLDRMMNTLGRAPDCDVVFPDSVPGMSRHHATIAFDEHGWKIIDAGSRNGTFVNKSPATTQYINTGDIVNLGPLALNVHLPEGFKSGPPHAGAPGRGASTKLVNQNVQFKSDGPVPSVSMSIKLADMSSTGSSGLPESVGDKLGNLAEGRFDISDDDPSGSINRQQWGIKLFSEIGEALVQTRDLDEMLAQILKLVFSHVPCERGSICLCGPGNELIPKAVQSRDEKRANQKLDVSLSIANEAINSQSSLLISDVSADTRFAEAQSIRSLNITSAMCVPLYHDGHVDGLIYVDTQNRQDPFRDQHLEVLTTLSLFSAVALEQARLRETIVSEQKKREKLSRYNSPAVVEQILAGDDTEDGGMSAMECDVSVLFADLCGFTSISENMEPPDVVKMLNEVFEMLSDCVFAHKGTLDKFMGDGMLAFFGAPLVQPNHAELAVQAALHMQKKLRDFNKARAEDKRISARIGINTGPAVVGDIGSQNRADYTVIGDTVNVASRLESTVAQPGQVVIGPGTYDAVRTKVVCKALEPVPLKGKTMEVQPYLALEKDSDKDTKMIPTISN